jgi:nanoRNase/pAp phosphatase (c-di-AMP/oligoRNAs hydrolase)
MISATETPRSRMLDLAPHFGDDARARAFAVFLESHQGEAHIVAVQDFPDPDAISSAMAYRTMAAEFDIEVDIVYEGRISHQENLALVHILSIDLIRFTEALPLDRYDGAVYIDNQGTTTRLTDRLREHEIPALAVIDHHAPQGVLEPQFSDVRPVGAAATILTDYLRSGEIVTLDPDSQAHVNLATALVHGLRTETNGLVRAGADELLASSYLSRLLDPELLERIMRVQRSHGTMDVIETALSERLVKGGFSLAGVGYLRHADRDAIPQAADFLITEENVHTAICYGIVQGEGERELVVGSVRTGKVTMDVDQFLKSALGSDFRGRYYGGGRERAGGFEIPVGFLEGVNDSEHMRLKWDTFNRQIQTKLLNAAGIGKAKEE